MYAWRQEERRKSRRIYLNLPAVFRIEGPIDFLPMLGQDEYAASTHDLSEGGISLIVGKYFPTSLKLKVKIFITASVSQSIRTSKKIIKLTGHIAHVHALNAERQYRIGIEFSDVSEDFDDIYFDLVCAPNQKADLI